MKINTNVNRFAGFIPQLSAWQKDAADFTASKTSTKWRNALQYKHSLHITAAFFNYENILRCHLLVMPGGQFSLRRLQLYIR